MNKTLKILILFVIALMLGTTLVSATTSEELAGKLYTMGSAYGITAADKVKMERYLAENPVTEAQANTIVAKAQEILNLADAEGVRDLTKLSAASKSQAISLANAAASNVGLTLDFSGETVKVYKDSKLVETISSKNGKLVYTGNEMNIALAVSAVVVFALVTSIVAKRKIANV